MKRILTIQDISCVGKCSLTVALPIISAAGVECSVLPTAVLSNHTAFPSFTFRDLTDEMQPIADKFKELSFDFDAIYTGYLGSFLQIELVEMYFDRFAGGNTVKLIDPVMADNGKLYAGFTPEFAARMAKLCAKADIIIPNLTEASFMLGVPYNPTYTRGYIEEILVKLTDMGAKYAALTGIGFCDGEIGVYGYDSVKKEFYFYANEKLPVAYHGTGDIFASLFLGAYMRGLSINESLKTAVDFTLMTMKKTMEDADRRTYGVNFEEILPDYGHFLQKR